MRKRDPGFYVSVLAPPGMGPAELFDGPWPTRAAANRRSEEIAAARPSDSAIRPTIVEIAPDGITILRESGPEERPADVRPS